LGRRHARHLSASDRRIGDKLRQAKGSIAGLRQAFLLAGETAINPDSHAIIAGTAPAGRTLRIRRSFVTTTSARPNDNRVQNPVQRLNEERQSTLTVPASGEFTWHTAPSTRPFEKTEVPWQLTCEDASGRVLESRQVFVARAQQVRVDLACADPARTAAPAPAVTTTSAPATGCADRFSPRSTFTRRSVKLTRKGITLRGRSIDSGCDDGPGRVRAAGLERVQVSVARTMARSRCRFLRADGRFARPRSCRQTSYLTARGTLSWSFVRKLRLPRGEYKIWVRALDRAKNIERKDARRNFVRVRVRQAELGLAGLVVLRRDLDLLVVLRRHLDLGQPAVQARAQLVGRDVGLGAAVAHEHHAGGRDATEAGQADDLPGDPHRRVGYAR